MSAKSLFLIVGTVLFIPVSFITYKLVFHNFTSQYAQYEVATTSLRLGIEIKAAHPMLAEYHRKLIVTWSESQVEEEDTFGTPAGHPGF